MKKAQRILENDARLVDLIIVVLDARAPAGTRNPSLETLLRKKKRRIVLVLNKSDLADRAATTRWIEALRHEGIDALAVSSRTGAGMKRLRALLDETALQVARGREEKGILEKTLRLMVAGIPNVGKSSLINTLVHGVSAKTGRKPGLTRGKQWLGLGGLLEVLDTPGIMMPRIEGDKALLDLALVGAIRDDVLPLEEIARGLLGVLEERRILAITRGSGDPLENYGRAKGLLGGGAGVDLLRTSQFLLKAFREGKFGPLTLEEPPPS
jgi:ribosome biogenesis GTPase A